MREREREGKVDDLFIHLALSSETSKRMSVERIETWQKQMKQNNIENERKE